MTAKQRVLDGLSIVLLLGHLSLAAIDELPTLQLIEDSSRTIRMCTAEIRTANLRVANLGPQAVDTARIVHNAGCNCIEIHNWSLTTIEKGQVAQLELTVDTTGKTKDFSVLFRALTDTNDAIKIAGELKIEIVEDIVLSQTFLDIGHVLPNEALEAQFNIAYSGTADINSISLAPALEGTYLETSIGKEKRGATKGSVIERSIKLKTRAPADSGRFEKQFYVVVRDGKKKTRRFKVVISGTVISEISVMPNRLFLGYVKPGTAISKQLVLVGQENKPFEVVKLETSKAISIVEHKLRSTSGWNRQLELTLKTDESARQAVMKASITIKVNLGDRPFDIVVPCVYAPAAQ